MGIRSIDGVMMCEADFEDEAITRPKGIVILGRQVIIIDRADQMSTQRFDKVLKTIEEPGAGVMFLFLATNLADVRRAGRSRCFHVKLSPLDETESLAFATTLLASHRQATDRSTLELIVAVGMGLPREIAKVVNMLSSTGMHDRRAVMAALDLDWPEQIAGHWARVLSSDDPLDVLLGSHEPLNVDHEDPSAERSRLFLLHMRHFLYPSSAPKRHCHPALHLMDDAEANRLTMLWRKRFKNDTLGEDQAWRSLMRLAGSDNFGLRPLPSEMPPDRLHQ